MDFQQLSIEEILQELIELKAEGLDQTALGVMEYVPTAVGVLRELGHAPTSHDMQQMLEKSPLFIDCARLFMGVSQESAAHELSAHLGIRSTNWSRLKCMAKKEPARLADALARVGLPLIIEKTLDRAWAVEDVLLDRYKLSRGRAIAGQQRGRSLEKQVETILQHVVPFESRVTFVGREGKTAKCDLAVPNRAHPKIIIEAKGFEATGSKLTDFLGDIHKIIAAKESRTYFFVVTDGRGWLNRTSDLQHVVDRQHLKDIDMVYTSARLGDLKRDVQKIWDLER